jgi:hypothetical protein
MISISRDRESAIDRINILSALYFQIFNKFPDDRIAAWCDRNNFQKVSLADIPPIALWKLSKAMQSGLETEEARTALRKIYATHHD